MSRHVDHNAEVVEQFTLQANAYGALTRVQDIRDREVEFRRIAQVAADDVTLDICCGTGAMTLALAPHVARITGLDLTPAMLEQAAAEQRRHGLDNVEWLVGDGTALPFADDSFSLVVCATAFHHLLDPAATLAEMVRVCRPGGRVLVRDVSPSREKVDAYDAIETLRDPSHTHALTREEFAALGAGLPVNAPELFEQTISDVPIDAILASSFPELCTIDDLRTQFMTDATGGRDELGFSAVLVEGKVRVTLPLIIARWDLSF